MVNLDASVPITHYPLVLSGAEVLPITHYPFITHYPLPRGTQKHHHRPQS
jgi:hypothetical protein